MLRNETKRLSKANEPIFSDHHSTKIVHIQVNNNCQLATVTGHLPVFVSI
jgi:hypothetical protein